MVVESPVSALPATSRAKAAAEEVPKKKDGRGRPRKDRSLELAKSAAVSNAVVRDKQSRCVTVIDCCLLSLLSSIKRSLSELYSRE